MQHLASQPIFNKELDRLARAHLLSPDWHLQQLVQLEASAALSEHRQLCQTHLLLSGSACAAQRRTNGVGATRVRRCPEGSPER